MVPLYNSCIRTVGFPDKLASHQSAETDMIYG